MDSVTIRTDDGDVSVWYREGHESWHVNTENIDGKTWRDYAVSQADEAMVRQLIRKEYDIRY